MSSGEQPRCFWSIHCRKGDGDCCAQSMSWPASFSWADGLRTVPWKKASSSPVKLQTWKLAKKNPPLTVVQVRYFVANSPMQELVKRYHASALLYIPLNDEKLLTLSELSSRRYGTGRRQQRRKTQKIVLQKVAHVTRTSPRSHRVKKHRHKVGSQVTHSSSRAAALSNSKRECSVTAPNTSGRVDEPRGESRARTPYTLRRRHPIN